MYGQAMGTTINENATTTIQDGILTNHERK
jgi:hypothetical protein